MRDARQESLLTKAKKHNRRVRAYKEVFNTTGDAGKLVLRDILDQLRFFSLTTATQEDIMLQNAARRILSRAGLWVPKNTDSIVDFLLRLEPEMKEEKKDA